MFIGLALPLLVADSASGDGGHDTPGSAEPRYDRWRLTGFRQSLRRPASSELSCYSLGIKAINRGPSPKEIGIGMNNKRARHATDHWIRYPQIRTPDQLALAAHPRGSVSWKIGPDGPVGPNGYRLPSNIWCGIALFAELADAEAALTAHTRYLSSLTDALESWHALLLPIAHRGECNHLERTEPGLIFDINSPDPGGPLFVMTTAGFNPGPDLELVHDWIKSNPGRIASQVFTPHTVGDDGVTMSFWRGDPVMMETMYKPGVHRTQIDRYKTEKTADRTSFTRFRVLRTSGQWEGRDPLKLAAGAIGGSGFCRCLSLSRVPTSYGLDFRRRRLLPEGPGASARHAQRICARTAERAETALSFLPPLRQHGILGTRFAPQSCRHRGWRHGRPASYRPNPLGVGRDTTFLGDVQLRSHAIFPTTTTAADLSLVSRDNFIFVHTGAAR
jgi:hypothetical protein